MTSIPAPDSDDNPRQIGDRLKVLRSQRGLSIMDLASKAGVSAGIISQIERGNSNPSVKTLQRIRAALGVNLWEFFAKEESRNPADGPFVRRKINQPQIVVGTSRIVKRLLSPQNDRNLRFMLLTIPPAGVSEDVLIGEGEKGGWVLSGRVELMVGEHVAELTEGDSFQFKADLPHKISNASNQDAEVLWIMSVMDTHV